MYREKYIHAFCNKELKGVSDYKKPESFMDALCVAIDIKIKAQKDNNKVYEKLQDLKSNIIKLKNEGISIDKLSSNVTKLENLDIQITELTGYAEYKEFMNNLKNRIILNAYDKATEYFSKMIVNNSKNLIKFYFI